MCLSYLFARGESSFFTLSIAGLSSRTCPLDETITGSMTRRLRPAMRRFACFCFAF